MSSARPRAELIVASITALAAGFACAIATASPATAKQTYTVPASKTWTIVGHGYGHGHGMSQWGAQGAALAGLDYTEIVRFYYPHTKWAETDGKVRVLISADTTSDLQVRARKGVIVRDLATSRTWDLPRPGGVDRWRLTPARRGATVLQLHDASGWHRWGNPDAPGPFEGDAQFQRKRGLTLLVPGGSDVVGRKYRGALRLARPSAGATTRDTVNVVRMDQYVQGVVPNEMPPSWDAQALRAQAVAARTFAAWQRSLNPRRYWQVCDTTSCQVYSGVEAEVESSNRAVKSTSGRILTHRGKPAMTQFSASSGGWTAAGGTAYLPAKKDPYDRVDGNYNHRWSVRVQTGALETAHPEIGRLISLRVSKRDGNGQWGGRVESIVLRGSKGNAQMSGESFRSIYGLKSSWFSIKQR